MGGAQDPELRQSKFQAGRQARGSQAASSRSPHRLSTLLFTVTFCFSQGPSSPPSPLPSVGHPASRGRASAQRLVRAWPASPVTAAWAAWQEGHHHPLPL